MCSDGVILASIVTPLVLIGIWLFFQQADREIERVANQLAANCRCPTCETLTLKWNGEVWGEQILYEDREEDFSGYVLRCSRCSEHFQFTDAGTLR